MTMRPEDWDPNAPVVVPDVDWQPIPATANLSTEYFHAYVRCMHHKELKKLRGQAQKLFVSELDAVLLPLGFRRDGDHWIKGPYVPGKPAMQEPRADEKAPEPGFWKRLTGGWSKAASEATSLAMEAVDESVYLAIQKDRRGFGCFINAGVRHAPAVGPYQFPLTLGLDHFYVARLSSFLPDLHPLHQPDNLHYVRLAEDERYRRFMITIIVSRIVPWLDAFNKRILLVSGPNPRDMAAKHPLPPDR
jgi:hypothetical protein